MEREKQYFNFSDNIFIFIMRLKTPFGGGLVYIYHMCCKWKNACKVSIKNRIDVKILTTNEKKILLLYCAISMILWTPLRGG